MREITWFHQLKASYHTRWESTIFCTTDSHACTVLLLQQFQCMSYCMHVAAHNVIPFIFFKLQCYYKFWRERYLQTSIWLILSGSQALLEGLLVDCSCQGKCAVYSFHAEHMEGMQNYSSSQRMKILMTHFNLNRSSWSDTLKKT